MGVILKEGGAMKAIMIILAIFGTIAWTAPQNYARVDVNINIGVPVPPPIVVETPPEMVIIPEAGVYVVVGAPYDLYFISGRYYYFNNGYWYWSRGYAGPWVHVEYRMLPPGLRKYKIERLHEFREHVGKEYRERGPAFKGKHFRAEAKEIAKERKEEKMQRGERDKHEKK